LETMDRKGNDNSQPAQKNTGFTPLTGKKLQKREGNTRNLKEWKKGQEAKPKPTFLGTGGRRTITVTTHKKKKGNTEKERL